MKLSDYTTLKVSGEISVATSPDGKWLTAIESKTGEPTNFNKAQLLAERAEYEKRILAIDAILAEFGP